MVNDASISARRFPGHLLIPFVLLLVVYLPALYDLVGDWYHDSNYSHGFLVPIVSAYLLWQKRRQLKHTRLEIDNRGLIVIIIGLVLFILGNGAAEYFTLRFSFIVTLFGLVWYLFGRALLRQTWFSLFFLVFMIPIPYVLYYAATVPMQLLASKITAVTLNAVGMDVVRQGNIIHIPNYSLEVADACSGIRSLVSLLALGALYAYMTQRRMLPRVLLFASTVPIAVAANVFRVLVTALLAYTVTTDVAQDPLHSTLGLSVFVVAFILLFITGAILRKLFR